MSSSSTISARLSTTQLLVEVQRRLLRLHQAALFCSCKALARSHQLGSPIGLTYMMFLLKKLTPIMKAQDGTFEKPQIT